MESYRIEPLQEADLEDVSGFLVEATAWRQDADEAPPPRRSRSQVLSLLRWRLLENPDRTPEVPLGQGLRDDDGNLLGVYLFFPSWFVLGDRRLLGLGSGSFYVDPRARIQGFFMFRRYLKTPGIDFGYATTCNAASGRLWAKFGGHATPGAGETHTLLLRAGPVAEDFARRGKLRGLPAPLARTAGQLATPLLRVGRRPSKFTFRPCDDWEHLAALAARHRNPQALTNERTSDYLRWRFELSPAAARNEIVAFQDQRGNAGWFVAQEQTADHEDSIIQRCQTLDLVFPAHELDPDDLLNALADRFAPRADVLDVPHDLAARSRLGRPLLWRRRHPVATTYLLAPSEPSGPLAEVAAFAPADGDRFD